MTRKTWMILAVAVAVVVAVYGYQMYNKERDDVRDLKPDFTMNASELYEAFEMDEARANEQYLGMVIQVTGVVGEVSSEDQSYYLLLQAGMMGMVQCAFTQQTGTLPQSGDEVTVRGKCSGFLMDVVLNDCVIITE